MSWHRGLGRRQHRLERQTALLRRTPMPRSKKPRPRPARDPGTELAYDDLLTLAYQRAGGRCERCGANLNVVGMDGHHRKLRSQGGRDDPVTVVAICRACHDWAHAHPADARAAGWMVRSTADPAMVAVVLWDGRTVRLDLDGGYDVVWDVA